MRFSALLHFLNAVKAKVLESSGFVAQDLCANLAPELIVKILIHAGLPADWRDDEWNGPGSKNLHTLAVSSKHIYNIFKVNEHYIFHQIAQQLAVNHIHPNDYADDTSECDPQAIIKLCIAKARDDERLFYPKRLAKYTNWTYGALRKNAEIHDLVKPGIYGKVLRRLRRVGYAHVHRRYPDFDGYTTDWRAHCPFCGEEIMVECANFGWDKSQLVRKSRHICRG